jgi:hypothetical protein
MGMPAPRGGGGLLLLAVLFRGLGGGFFGAWTRMKPAPGGGVALPSAAPSCKGGLGLLYLGGTLHSTAVLAGGGSLELLPGGGLARLGCEAGGGRLVPGGGGCLVAALQSLLPEEDPSSSGSTDAVLAFSVTEAFSAGEASGRPDMTSSAGWTGKGVLGLMKMECYENCPEALGPGLHSHVTKTI